MGANSTKNPSEANLDKNNLDDAQSKIEQAQKRILDSTTRSIGKIEESHNIAIKTAEEWHRREESLRRAEQNLDDMRNMTSANKDIKSVESENHFNEPPMGSKKQDTTQQARENSVPEILLVDIDIDVQLNHAQEDNLSSYGEARGTNAFERQYKSNLDEISRALSNLKDDAIIMGEIHDRQNEILNRILQGKVGLADPKVKGILRR